MKIALAQVNPTIGAFQKNSAKILYFIEDAKNKGAELVIFPELSLVGYPPLDLLDKDHFVEDNLKALNALAKQIHGISAIVGYVEKNKTEHGKPYHNAAAVLSEGEIVSKHYKSLLPSYDVFDEARHFEPSHHVVQAKINKKAIALSICEDIWNDKDFWKRRLYKTDPLPSLLKPNPFCLINISASPFSMGKQKTRKTIIQSLAQKYKTPLIYVNQVGSNDQIIFDGASLAMNNKGEIIAQCKDFEEDLVLVDLETGQGEIHPVSKTEIEAIYKALVLGIRDYFVKCGFKQVLIGLSGGIDSAVASVLAADALGKENVIGIMMPSRYSSKGSIEDAMLLTKNLGIRTDTVSIEPIFSVYLDIFKRLFKNGDTETTEQNIQARIRGNILMSLSNQLHALVLSTGNKSEMAMGYCTLYGDMSGGLSVLADVPKTLVYELARYINSQQEIIPQTSITKAPSAELKPNQKDQDTLPPYEILDKILTAYIEEHYSIAKITKMGFARDLVESIVTKVDMNEYKRRQSPPALRVTQKAFGIGRRLPIAQQYKEFS